MTRSRAAKRAWLAVGATIVVGLLAACSASGGTSQGAASAGGSASSGAASPAASEGRAVVLVSGLATQTPYTTTTAKCTTGLSAGDSVSALRDSLVAAGNRVYTAPAQAGPGVVESTSGMAASSGCPPPLPADLTINTTAGLDQGGAHLAAFLSYLHDHEGVTTVDLVGHSMGGLFARGAIGDVAGQAGSVKVRSLIALSTPWTGTFPADYAEGILPLSVCGTEQFCLKVLPDYKAKLSAPEGPEGAANVIGTRDLQGPNGWNVAQGDDLAGIPVTLIGGDRFSRPGGLPSVWPNDGIVSKSSALAEGLAGAPLAIRSCLVRPDVHTIGLAAELGLPWTASVTWDPVVLAAVAKAVAGPVAGGQVATLGHC